MYSNYQKTTLNKPPVQRRDNESNIIEHNVLFDESSISSIICDLYYLAYSAKPDDNMKRYD